MEEEYKTDNQGRRLYKAICAECQVPTFVPFEPDTRLNENGKPKRPVYCKHCWMQKQEERDKEFAKNRNKF